MTQVDYRHINSNIGTIKTSKNQPHVYGTVTPTNAGVTVQ